MASTDKTNGRERSLLWEDDFVPLLTDQVDVPDVRAAATVFLAGSLEPSRDLAGSFTINAQTNQLFLRVDDRPVTTTLIAFYS